MDEKLKQLGGQRGIREGEEVGHAFLAACGQQRLYLDASGMRVVRYDGPTLDSLFAWRVSYIHRMSIGNAKRMQLVQIIHDGFEAI